MQINFQAKNMERTEAINDYVVKRITNLGKLLSEIEKESGEAQVLFNISKTTQHHKGGEFFHADCSVSIKGKKYYSSTDKEDLYQAIDAVKENLFNEISRSKDKQISLFHRGARKIKNTIKGITSWKK